jgi:uncharacterized protein YfaS (alpha-2-macroglobulin family)
LKTYIRGNIARFIGVFKDAAGASSTPTSPSVTVYDPFGDSKVSDTPTNASGTGRYVYNLVTATNWELGRYRVEFYGTGTAGTVRESAFFELILGDDDT